MKKTPFYIAGAITLISATGVIMSFIVHNSFSQTMKRQRVVIEAAPDVTRIREKKKWQRDTAATRLEKRMIADTIRREFAVTDSNSEKRKTIVALSRGTNGKLMEIKTLNDTLLQMAEAKKNRIPEFIIIPDVKPKPVVNPEKVDPEKVPASKKKRWLRIFLK